MSKPDLEIQLPFGGFYESIWSEGIDSELEQTAEYDAETEKETYGECALDQDELREILWDATDYSTCYKAVAKTVVDAIEHVLDDELGIKITLTYSAMESPRFYNYSTDRLFAKISRDDVAKLVRIVRSDRYAELRKVLKDRHTSYDGFSSFYSNDLSKWLGKPVSQWDHNELESLLLAAAETAAGGSRFGCRTGRDLWNWAVYEAATDCDSLSHEFQSGVDWNKYEAARIEKRTEKAEELGLIEEGDSPEKIPARCEYTADLFRR